MEDKEEDPATFEAIKAKLSNSKIFYGLTFHEAVRTSQEAADVRGATLESGAKAMLLAVQNKDILIYILSVMSAAKKLSWKKVRALLGTKKVSMASEQEVWNISKCLPGAVPPFGSIMGIKTICDKSLVSQGTDINFNCGLRTASIMMKVDDYLKTENPQIEDFTE